MQTYQLALSREERERLEIELPENDPILEIEPLEEDPEYDPDIFNLLAEIEAVWYD